MSQPVEYANSRQPPDASGEPPRLMAGLLRCLLILLILVLSASALGTGWMAYRAKSRLDEVTNQLQSVELSHSSERKERQKHERLAQQARATAADSQAIADLLSSALTPEDPNETGDGYAVVEALAQAERALEGGQYENHPAVLIPLRRTIGESYARLGMFDKAESQLRQILEMNRKRLAEDDPGMLESLCGLARVLVAKGQPEGQQLYEQAGTLCDQLYAQQPWRRVLYLYSMAESSATGGQFDRAIGHSEYALDLLTRQFGPEHPQTIASRIQLASVLRRAGRLDDATATAERACTMLRNRLPPGYPKLADALAGLGVVYVDAGRFAKAEEVLRECLEIREAKLPSGHWLSFNAMVLLGRAVAGQERYKEAEHLMVKGFEGLQASEDAPATRKREACEAIVQMFESSMDSANADRYREMLAGFEEPTTRPAPSRRPALKQE